jgi:predicted kinase
MGNLYLAHRKLLLAMAGLPGTGKSAIASELGKRLGALVLNKDKIRLDLFTNEAINYSSEQDDLCMRAIFIIAEYVLRTNPDQTIIIDGRTFSKSYQIEQLLSRAELLKVKPVIIECICSDNIVKQRLDEGHRSGVHPARNRTYKLYLELQAKAEPITVDRLIIDTGEEPLEKSVDHCIEYLTCLSR